MHKNIGFERGQDPIKAMDLGVTIERSVQKLVIELKEDPEYFYSWQSNIAMAFFDEYRRNNKKYKNRRDLLNISNEAAKNFLDLLIK